MKTLKIVGLIALVPVLAACTATRAMGNGVYTVASAPVKIMDGTLQRAERVVSLADRTVQVADRAMDLTMTLPLGYAQSEIAAAQAGVQTFRTAANGVRAVTQGSYPILSHPSSPYSRPTPTYGYTSQQPTYTSSAPVQTRTYTASAQTRRVVAPRQTYTQPSRQTTTNSRVVRTYTRTYSGPPKTTTSGY